MQETAFSNVIDEAIKLQLLVSRPELHEKWNDRFSYNQENQRKLFGLEGFEVYRKFDFPGAEDIGNMFQFKRDFEGDFCKARNLNESRQLNSKLMSFDGWLKEYGDQIPIAK